MNTATTQNANGLIPLQLFATQYGYAALLDAEGNEQLITQAMIQSACEEAMDALYSFLPQRSPVSKAQMA